MCYRIEKKDCIKHSALPNWALLICAEVSVYFSNTIVEKDERLVFLRTIQSHIRNNISFTVRNTIFTGEDIPVHINEDDKTLTIYSLTGGRSYVEYSFSPTEEACTKFLI